MTQEALHSDAFSKKRLILPVLFLGPPLLTIVVISFMFIGPVILEN